MQKREPYDVLDLKALRCFFAVGKHASLTKAGLELGITDVAVSLRIRKLEHYLGVKLYEARGGRVQLTPAGERTMSLAVTMFDEIEDFEHAVAHGEETGEIVLAAHDEILGCALPEVVAKFVQAHPRARLRLLARSVEETIRLVRMNEIDIGVIPERTLPKELSFRPFATYPAYLVTPKGHPLARQARANFTNLVNEETIRKYPLVVAEVQLEGYVLAETFARHGLPLNVGIEVGTVNTLKQYVARGLGIAVISGLALTRADRSSLEIVPIPPELGGDSTYGVVMRRQKHRTRLLADLVLLLSAGTGKSLSLNPT